MIKKYIFLAVILVMVSGLPACLPATPPEPEPVPTPSDEEFYEFFHGDYYETPEDCLPGEVYDPVEQLCFCEEIIEDDWYSDDFYDLVDDFADDFFSGEQDFEEIGGTGEDPFIIYEIQGNDILNPQKTPVTEALQTYQDDTAKHREIWVYFARLIPQENREHLSKFAVFTDGIEGTMAAVELDIEGDPARWILYVDIQDAADMKELTYSLIHEFGHILTLNYTQVEPNIELLYQPDDEELLEEAAASCDQYFTWEGCSLPDSYINVFFNRFWSDIYDEWLDIQFEEDDDVYYTRIDNFYFRYQDQFVTDYAATDPGEDIAESWTYFVLKPKPEGNTIAEQKVLFFYEYEELVELRAKIIPRAFSRLRR
jgi:hypothetical protein